MNDQTDEKPGSSVFVSYARADAEASDQMRLILERLGTWRHLGKDLRPWSDRSIGYGSPWESEILHAIQRARIAIVLLGPKFFESRFIREQEIPELLLAAGAGGLKIIPVLVYGDGSLLDRMFKYPDHKVGPRETSLRPFQGIAEALDGMEPAEQVSRLADLENAVLQVVNRPRVPTAGREKPVLVVGSGLVENNLLSKERIELDYKHVIKRVRCYGGSGVNYATRLGRIGIPVLPILSIGDDGAGREIQQSLLRDCHESVRAFINDKSFLCRGIRTSETYIAISEDQRTTFTEHVRGVEAFPEFCRARLGTALEHAGGDFAAVMIGHVYADDPALGLQRCLTADIAKLFRARSLIFANLGVSQINRGSQYWREQLKNFSVLQLTVQEATHFFADDSKRTLLDMLSWFAEVGASTILTHDAYGAVAVLSETKDQMVASRFPIEGVVDKTGAGDSFGCGVVYSLLGSTRLNLFNLMGALDEGRKWGACACTSIGGSNGSPELEELETFKSSVKDDQHRIQCGGLSDALFLDRVRLIWESERIRHRKRT